MKNYFKTQNLFLVSCDFQGTFINILLLVLMIIFADEKCKAHR